MGNSIRQLYFNPWNDLALAAGDPHYTPPASARQMARDLAGLPRLWGGEPFVPGAAQAPFLVWGWSPLLVRLLREAGVEERCLPTADQMDAYRAWSSRQMAVGLLQRLRTSCPEAFSGDGALVGKSSWCRTTEEVLEAHARYGRSMLKAPWSGSGRGVHPVATATLTPRDLAWVQRTLQRQGGVEAEPLYERVQDFALEFWAEEGHVRYEGLSLFATTPGGVYAGNLVASEDEKLRRLARYVNPALVRGLCTRLTHLLSTARLPEWYTGPLGVDMMVVQPLLFRKGDYSPPFEGGAEGRGFLLHPLVEVNLRMTMGWVALQLAPQLAADEVATFRIGTADGHYRAFFDKNEPL